MADSFDMESGQAPINAGGGITLIAPGLSGTGSYYGRRDTGSLRKETTLESPEFIAALDESQLEEAHTLILPAGGPLPAPEAERSRVVGKVAADEIELRVPKDGAGPQYIIYQDEDGVLSIEMPEPTASVSAERIRGIGSSEVLRYKLNIRRAGGDGKTRGVLGILGKKVIKVIARKLGAAVGTKLVAGLWESKARNFEGFHWAIGSQGAELLNEFLTENPQPFTNWEDLDGKKSLRFIHGTTSTTAGAFGGLCGNPDAAAELFRRYENRVIGFNHHTLGRSVCENATRLYAELEGRPGRYAFDIICHSRGGLLARTLKELDNANISALTNAANWVRPAQSGLEIDRIVFVATPNMGTDLASGNNLPKWLNRMANLASLLLDSAGSAPLAAVLAVASDVAASAVKLPGLADMSPTSKFLEKLNAAEVDSRPYWAVEAFYPPEGRLKRAIEDPIIDGLFLGKENDLVVPTEGVSIVIPSFRLDERRVKKFSPEEAVSHTHFFTKKETWDHILFALK